MKKISLVFALVMIFTAVFGEFAHAQERKKWSPQAKGAVIGGLGGAAAGAIINKRNRAVGGVIGGAAGAGIGYAIGKRTDNKRKREAESARIVAAHRAAAQRSAAYRASATKESSTKPAGAKALTADELYMLNTSMVATPTVAGVAYLPNKSSDASAAAYPSSEVRRKSW